MMESGRGGLVERLGRLLFGRQAALARQLTALVSVCGVPNLKVMRSPHLQSSTMKKLQEHETGKLAKSRLVIIALFSYQRRTQLGAP